MEKIVKDQEEFEKEHQFMQVNHFGIKFDPDFYLILKLFQMTQKAGTLRV